MSSIVMCWGILSATKAIFVFSYSISVQVGRFIGGLMTLKKSNLRSSFLVMRKSWKRKNAISLFTLEPKNLMDATASGSKREKDYVKC